MLKPNSFEQLFAKVKDYLPDMAIQDKVKKILEEHHVVTQEQIQHHLKQVEKMRAELQKLVERIEKLEKSKKTK